MSQRLGEPVAPPRVLFLIPQLLGKLWSDRLLSTSLRIYQKARWKWLVELLHHPGLYTPVTYGGTLNLMRNAALVRSLGFEARLATPDGRDSYGGFKVVDDVPFIRWSERRPDDLCVVPDFCTNLMDEVEGRAIAYLQTPVHLRADFNYLDPRFQLWTDSPFMLEKCQRVYPGKDITIVPNIVDPRAFAFRPQCVRDAGLLFAFPRKGAEFIAATERAYAVRGGRYWRFRRVDGLSLNELAAAMRRPQAFLASADVEGCALPPQEAMAAGIVVVGKSARGANFSMVHRETAMVAETPEAAADALTQLEDAALREHLSRQAHTFISRYFPNGEPREHWRTVLNAYCPEAGRGTTRGLQRLSSVRNVS